ncbi:hypothetical protein ACSTKX_24820, partial [Vibrio parahaemolyticus]
ISYLPQDKAHELLLNLHKKTPSKARVVIRSFLKAPTEMSLGSWKEDSKNAKWAFNLDGTGVYQFHIYEKG